MGSRPKRTVALTTFWTVVFFLAIAIRVVFGSLGEWICTFLLVVGTTFAFTAAASGSIIRIADGHGDSVSDCDGHGERHGERRDSDEATELQPTSQSHHTHTHTTAPSTGAARDPVATATAAAAPSSASRRLPFLDNLRVFLTAVVVTHHVACAFGGCGTDAWYRVVDVDGGPPPGFHELVGGLALLNQSYFMPLFFFVSAYFVPSSYARAGGSWERFATTKRKRLLFPALVECFVVAPLAIILSGNAVYFPNPGVAWFLFWLLLFQIVYASFRSVHQDDDDEATATATTTIRQSSSSSSSTQQTTNDSNSNFEPLLANPSHGLSLQSIAGTVANEEVATADTTDADASAVLRRTKALATNGRRTIVTSTWLRMACGAGICGVALLPFLALQLGFFASMPIFPGSLTCDFFMFHQGLEAHRQRWFDTKPLVEQLDIHPSVLALVVVAEYMAMATISFGVLLPIETWGPLLVVIAGMFCLDMSLLVLVVFQRWCNVETRVTRFFARGAYAVYLTHPIVVVGTTLLYMRICDYYYYGNHNDNDDDDRSDASQSDEDYSYDYYYPLGFIFVNIVSHLINWPLAYFLAQLPFLETIL
jgi:hypothetical protein